MKLYVVALFLSFAIFPALQNVLPEEIQKHIETAPDVPAYRTYTESREKPLDLRIVVVSMLEEDENKDIYLMDETGRNPKRLTTYPSIETFPCITDDGNHLFFTSDMDGKEQANPFQIYSEIYHLDLRTEELTRLTNDDRMDYGLSVSGDGSRIVYMTQEMGQDGYENPQMILMDGDGNNQEVIQDEAIKNCIPEISGDGNWVVFNSYRDGSMDIFLMDLRDPEEYKTTNLTNSFVSEYFPTINYDGTVIVYEKLLNGIQDETMYELCRIDPVTLEETYLTYDRFCDSFPTLTNDGEWVVFVSKRWDWDRDGHLNEALFLMDINGENLKKISKHRTFFYQPDV